ncbi:YvrJ family protein [Evansella clarkii]|jgi:hypothetical protein|uniref:YvrJ family protein n=1 Tax=Evansella clarkii TaxID=79879 RepID=UPI00099894A7|nr:YvrJ family protein [Evansella clarkii]
MEFWPVLIGEYGFPVAVTFYLLYRIEKKLDQLNHSVLYLAKLYQHDAGFQPSDSDPVPEWPVHPGGKQKINMEK